ncbi:MULTISPECIES: hypothetical protein [Calothrix]|uniref:Lipocalin-like domain-containing protein n=2 Tax=Calothrix TaxID=1186 RepID=A0ABR8A4H5_9CYAN|nr:MULTISPECIES: hypothetical protein [Calothrix]MBD2194806.1 hypothetical protein [Calothrix parietina FACHB-288]MBD2228806.1 hypothetical protein [Calothrix anomala FACHB-343]
MTHDYSDKEIESLVIGKWQYEHNGFSYFEEFQKNFTYQIMVQGKNLITMSAIGLLGSKFTGSWYVKDSTLHLINDNNPNSLLNLDLLGWNFSLMDIFKKYSPSSNLVKRQIFSIDQKHMSLQVKSNSYIIIFRKS